MKVLVDKGVPVRIVPSHHSREHGIVVDAPEDFQMDIRDKYEFDGEKLVRKVPQEVTRRQAKQALLLYGILNNVQAAIDAIPEATQRGLVQIEWDDSISFKRHRPTLLLLAAQLGLTSTDLDNLFILADTL